MIGILLAAGRGTRMKSDKPKVLFEVNDEPMAFGALKSLLETCEEVCVVVGYRAADVESALMSRAVEVIGEKEAKKRICFALQDPPRGTGDAVKKAINELGKKKLEGSGVIVANGDLPLIRAATLKRLIKDITALKLTAACLSMRTAQPQGLGRILRDDKGFFVGIREEKDATADEKRIREVNGGVYYFDGKVLAEAIQKLNTKNAQGEFYLTDLLGNRDDKFRRSEAILLRAPWDLLGVNNTFELASVRKMAQARLQKKLCEDQGVDFLDPATTYVSARANFEGASRVGPGTVIKGRSVIQKDVVIDGQCYIEDSTIAEGAHLLWSSVVRESKVGEGCSVGPMAHLRPGSDLGKDVKVGNFVELKKTKMAAGSKASHLTYLGDAEVGAESNIGCGTITCNYDGFNKHKTVIGKKVFVGSDSQLIAPITLGDGAYVASGTTVTRDVPAGALAIGRAEFKIKEGYADRLNRKFRSRGKGEK